MENKKFIWGGLAGGLTFFLLGWLFYGVLLMSFMQSQTTAGVYKEMPDFPFLLLGNIFMGFLYSLVIVIWAKATSPGDGAKKGLLFGLLYGAGFDLIMYGTSNIMTLQGLLCDIVVTAVMGTIVGAVVTKVMGSASKG